MVLQMKLHDVAIMPLIRRNKDANRLILLKITISRERNTTVPNIAEFILHCELDPFQMHLNLVCNTLLLMLVYICATFDQNPSIGMEYLKRYCNGRTDGRTERFLYAPKTSRAWGIIKHSP